MTPEMKKSMVLFTDGACKGNPGPGGWGLIIVSPEGRVRELGASQKNTTNNRMEMTAVLEGLKAVAGSAVPVMVFTDSSYLINGMTSWVQGWIKKGWVTAAGKEVLNKDLWQQLLHAAKDLKVSYHHVKGHAGIPGNERADTIASSFGAGFEIPMLYEGPLDRYPLDPYEVSVSPQVPAKSSRGGASLAGGSGKPWYLSLVGGQLRRHRSWPDCERVTKGRPGAKFKKVKTPEEERSVLLGWGVGDQSFS